MPTPEFITQLREKIGHEKLWLSGATAVIVRPEDGRILLVRRSDNGLWTPVTGIVDPGENPALTCLREAEEEAGVKIEVVALTQIKADPSQTFSNGDQCQFLDHTFLCHWVSGQARVNDEESSEVRWVTVDELKSLVNERMYDRIDSALNYSGYARFGFESV
ncbi:MULTISPECIES: NUDIX domain-containing protein [unclassified Rothia (in: high G+C Gram-positive bacteria)]|uniref:NUDIX hydrolase n=1 Tax=unclassified Rothia (in: high G+C Gram-positive bacteria) TaxID=2689056 RepID=UPI00195BEF81|nr:MULTISPECIES: NUDIX domain-containing protein [unclassified Rothia (in: high G+C Gram-positive bacteria)]MBM7051439.1 NUDIX domain-containing protein [Rothia sp. ZJ1223]QRZ61231.1 NUDIX domain-containing protein [Rothia sp. ZJ932]